MGNSNNAVSAYLLTWSSGYRGPDGPWQAISVNVGSDASGNPGVAVDLYPGGTLQTIVNSNLMCNGSTAGCLAASAGLYDPKNSTTAFTNITTVGGQTGPSIGSWGSANAMGLEGYAVAALDTLWFTSTPQGSGQNVPNVSLSVVSDNIITLPNASTYPSQIGSLSLGQVSATQSLGDDVAEMIPGFLQANNYSPSNSFTLHIGSASLGPGGSLTFGGYDKSRVLGDVGIFDFNTDVGMSLSLLDIEIGVENGGSPFDFISQDHLLRQNSTSPRASMTVINPLVPYLFLSADTCAAIAQHLPVTLQSDIGLYTWNTADPRYQRIVSSPAYLQFVFENKVSSNTSIKVPFQLLNLTLEAPIVAIPQPYFPCRPHSQQILGRAFLQAASVGVNWQYPKMFIAQAPGPAAGDSDTRQIQGNNITIDSNPISAFALSWSQKWVPLPNNTNTTLTPYHDSTANNGLSDGAKAGIGVGVAVAALAIAVLMALAWIRRRRRRLAEHQNERARVTTADPDTGDKTQQLDSTLRHEMEVHPQEVGQELVHEML